MNDFISTVRTDRQREINMKEKSGIVVSDKYRYRIVDTIMVIMPDGTKLTYGFQANHRDVYFFMIDEGANSYFSIVEIYYYAFFGVYYCNLYPDKTDGVSSDVTDEYV